MKSIALRDCGSILSRCSCEKWIDPVNFEDVCFFINKFQYCIPHSICFAMQKYGCVTILCVSAAKASMEKLSKARPASKKNKDSKLKPLTEHDLSVVCMTSPLIFENHDLHAALCLMSHIFINVIFRKWNYSNLDTVGLCVLSSTFVIINALYLL